MTKSAVLLPAFQFVKDGWRARKEGRERRQEGQRDRGGKGGAVLVTMSAIYLDEGKSLQCNISRVAQHSLTFGQPCGLDGSG